VESSDILVRLMKGESDQPEEAAAGDFLEKPDVRDNSCGCNGEKGRVVDVRVFTTDCHQGRIWSYECM